MSPVYRKYNQIARSLLTGAKVYSEWPKFLRDAQSIFRTAKVYPDRPKLMQDGRILHTRPKVYSQWPKFIYIQIDRSFYFGQAIANFALGVSFPRHILLWPF